MRTKRCINCAGSFPANKLIGMGFCSKACENELIEFEFKRQQREAKK